MRTIEAVLALVIVLSLSGCSVVQKQIQDFQKNASPEIIDQINGWIEDQGLDPEATKARAEILMRAESWIVLGVPYGSFDDNPLNDYFDGYRADCSGFISMAWQLKNSTGGKFSATTVSLGNYATEIPFEELLSGDVINNQRGDKKGHVVMFVSWLNDDQTRFVAFEENGGYRKAVQTELNLELMPNGGYTIKEYDPNAPGPYIAQTHLTTSE